jgi:hypothetical protein
MALHRAGAEWRTSSYSGANGDCVEVATSVAGAVAVRDSKDRGGPVLRFSPASWQAFVEGVREGGAGTR